MKKFLSILFAAVLTVSLTACGSPKETPKETIQDHIPSIEENSFGELVWNDFETIVNENKDADTKEIATKISEDEKIPFKLMVEDINPEYFAGFSNEFKPTGYKEATLFQPMIGSIPFVGYVFEMEENSDIEAFISSLTENADPRWNICVEADQTISGSIQNKVLFVMCPKDIDE